MISACLVVYNEENYVRKCLESINGVVDEIILVHDGPCLDNTLKIAKKYGAKIFVRRHVGEAEPHRTFSFEKAKGNWILQIDADEFLSEELQKNLRVLAKDDSVDAYAFYWEDPDKLFFFGIWPLKQHKSCFFRKSKIVFQGLVHEQTKTSGKLVNSEFLLHHKPNRDISRPDTFRYKTRHWGEVAARTLMQKNLARHSACFYLIKAPIWAMVYLLYYLFIKCFVLCGKNGLWVTLSHTMYNFWLNYYLYAFKRHP